MKRALIFVLVFLLLGVTACGSTKINERSEEEKSEASEEGDKASSLEESFDESYSNEISEESSEEVSKPQYLDGKKLVVFGDSITALGSWGRDTAEELNMYFFNGAKGGITSAEGIGRFDAFVASQMPDFVTILFGMNDLIMTSSNTPKVTPEQFGKNLKIIIGKVIDCGAKPILLTSNPLNPNTFFSAQGQNKAWYSEIGSPLDWLDVYNEVTRKVAEETKTPLIDMRKYCDGMSYSTLLSDGIHLADKGNSIFRSYLTAWFRKNYDTDPNAKQVSVEDTYVNVTKDMGYVSMISFDKDDWYVESDKILRIKEGPDNKYIILSNTNGLWPDAQLIIKNPIRISVADGVLKFKTSSENVSSSFVLYFDGAIPSAFTANQQLVINKYLGGNCDSYTGDILGSQRLEGSIPLSRLNIPASVIHDGYVIISGVQIYVAGNSYKNVTVRELSVGLE